MVFIVLIDTIDLQGNTIFNSTLNDLVHAALGPEFVIFGGQTNWQKGRIRQDVQQLQISSASSPLLNIKLGDSAIELAITDFLIKSLRGVIFFI